MEQIQPPQPSGYALGHAEDELDRLINHARFFDDLTEHALHLAGLAPGMRVLDVGCGPGDVTFMAARLVGPEGAVIGVDTSLEAIELARQRAAAARLTNVHFLAQDLSDSELVLDEAVDAPFWPPGAAVRCRPGPAAAPSAHLCEARRAGGLPGGWGERRSVLRSSLPVYETTLQRIKQTFTRIGAEARTGHRLVRIFEEAGLPTPQMILHSRVERGPDSPIYDVGMQMTRVMLPLMQRTGVATAEEVGVETLAERMRAEAVALDATLVFPALIGAWTCKPLTNQ
jgi:hypothetical protein